MLLSVEQLIARYYQEFIFEPDMIFITCWSVKTDYFESCYSKNYYLSSDDIAWHDRSS